MSATTDNIMNRVIDWVNNRLRVDATLSQSANIIGKVGIDQTTPGTTNATTDSGAAWTSSFGVSGESVTSADATSTPLVITDAPTSGQKIVLDDIEISSAVQTLITVRTTTSNKILGRYRLPADGTIQVTTRGKKKSLTADKTLEVISSAAGNIYVGACYHSEV